MGMTKNQFLEVAAKAGIEVSEDESLAGVHFHAYSPKGKRFAATGTHNIGLATLNCYRSTHDWNEALKDLELENCDDPDCDYCHEED